MIQIIEVPPFQDPGSVIRNSYNVTIAKVPGRAHSTGPGTHFPNDPLLPFRRPPNVLPFKQQASTPYNRTINEAPTNPTHLNMMLPTSGQTTLLFWLAPTTAETPFITMDDDGASVVFPPEGGTLTLQSTIKPNKTLTNICATGSVVQAMLIAHPVLSSSSTMSRTMTYTLEPCMP